MLLYGCDNRDMIPNRDAIVELFKGLRAVEGVNRVGVTHWTFAGVVANPMVIADLAKINGLGHDNWTGVQVGLETASPRLVKKHMPYKTKPFSPEEYPRVIREGIRIMNENFYYPACTLIIGLPDETDEDVEETIAMVKQLKGARCILAPLLYVDYWKPERSLTFESMSSKQWELFRKCWVHNLSQINHLIWQATESFSPVTRISTMVLTKWATKRIMQHLRSVAYSRSHT